MNATIGNQLDQRLSGCLAAKWVKATDNDDAGGVVDDYIDAGFFFERANVASFTANDPPLHFIIRDIDGAGRRFGCVGRGISLECRQH